MKIDSRTIAILKNFSTINNSILFKAGNVLSTVSETKEMFARATVKTEFPAEFAIYDLPRFISVLSLFDDPELSVTDKFVTIKGNGRSARYALTSPAMIVVPPNRQIDTSNPDVQFALPENTLTSIQKALNVMQLPELVMTQENNAIILKAINSKESSSDNFNIVLGASEKKFNAIFRPDKLKFMPADYNVDLMFRGFMKVSNEEIEYVVSVEKESTFGS